MGFSLSGLAGAGAADGLEELLVQRLRQQEAEARRVNEAFARELQQKQLASLDLDRQHRNAMDAGELQLREFDAMRKAQQDQRDADATASTARSNTNAMGLLQMGLDPETLQREMLGQRIRQNGVTKDVMDALTPPDEDYKDLDTYDAQGRPETRAVSLEERKRGVRARENKGSQRAPNIQVRQTPSRGPNGEPGSKLVVFTDGVPSYETWEPANPSASERKDFADFTTLKSTIDQVRKAYNAYPNTGPVQGRVDAVRQALPGVEADPGYMMLSSQLAQLQNQLLYLRSGKAINENEFKRMMGELPTMRDKGPAFIQKLANTERLMVDFIGNREAAAGMPGGSGGGSSDKRIPTEPGTDAAPKVERWEMVNGKLVKVGG